jgi:bifunctional UDP-N-acetylglucosamine pyrophosphorylase/glucosamine-1-phosphate N-acetyltransferase
MRSYILAAGDANRMSPIETNKPFLPVGDKTISDKIEDNLPTEKSELVTQEGGGTGSTAKIINENKPFMLSNGDIVPSVVPEPEDIPTVYTHQVKEASGYGVIKYNKIIEKQKTGPALINAGIYYLDSNIFEFIDEVNEVNGEIRITDALNKYETIHTKKLNSWLSVEYPWDLLNAQTGQYISDDASVHQDAIIRGNSYIGPNVKVGKNAEIKESVLLEGVTAEHHCYIGDSVVGKNVNVGAGVVTANMRHDEKNVSSNGVDTNRRKFGAVIGPRAKLGANTTLNPGTVIEADEWTLAGEVR